MNPQEAPEIWGGLECTVNRIGDQYLDQLECNGHLRRETDLQMFAELGLRTLRYPILWEKIAPKSLKEANWQETDSKLKLMQALGLRPIAGLVHHGSGPMNTNLLDPAFPEKFAEYAGAVAERYPWLGQYTPVNEPLTTARFSGLYGFWHPHKKDDRSFLRALINECKATVLAMRAIRAVNPKAELVQTEDLGKTFSTPKLAYQADFENERRWLSFDLLLGKIDRNHPLWGYFRQADIAEQELEWFCENSCTPTLIGINHYLTSVRYLDENLDNYPPSSWGGNGRDRYADTEAVRACAENNFGPEHILREVWERYKLPMAVTEVHLGCTREEQMRWFLEVWEAAKKLKAENIPLKAVTAWSLLGSYDWNSLVTCPNRHYETGVYDVRPQRPRPTALAKMLSELMAQDKFEHPLTQQIGWWHRPERLLYAQAQEKSQVSFEGAASTKPLLITGATGTLGKAFARICKMRNIPFVLTNRYELNICTASAVRKMIDKLEPWAIVNTAGYVKVDRAEEESERCFQENAEGPSCLAQACSERNIPLLTFSSDLVFNGNKTTPYLESDPVEPLNAYGRSKRLAEELVLHKHPKALIVRTSAFFGPWDPYNFVAQCIKSLKQKEAFEAAFDCFISPTYVPDLVNASLDLLIDEENGVWHLANQAELSWYELAKKVALMAGLNDKLVLPKKLEDCNYQAMRPRNSVLASEKGQLLPSFDDALKRYLCEASSLGEALEVGSLENALP